MPFTSVFETLSRVTPFPLPIAISPVGSVPMKLLEIVLWSAAAVLPVTRTPFSELPEITFPAAGIPILFPSDWTTTPSPLAAKAPVGVIPM